MAEPLLRAQIDIDAQASKVRSLISERKSFRRKTGFRLNVNSIGVKAAADS